MTTYLESLTDRYNAQSHHTFLLHGATRDLQLGNDGSCDLITHMIQNFSALDRLVIVYRVGIGWRFAVKSDAAKLKEITGLADNSTAGDFAGLAGNEDDNDLPLDLSSAIGLIDLAMRQTQMQVVCILDRAELIAPASQYDRLSPADKAILSMLQAIASDRSAQSTRNILILTCDALTDLAESLRLASSRYYAIEILPPTREERASIADQVLPQLQARGCDVQLTASEFAQSTSMMTRYGLMDILLDARSVGSLTKTQVRMVKSQVMSQEYGDILETLDPLVRGYDAIAGLPALKDLFTEIVDNMIAGNIGDVPAGLLLAGAAGLGKSYFMRGVAGQSGLPVINFNVGRLLGSLVGQSERNLERALTAIRSAAPCIVVLDEIETTFPDRANAGPNGDSGVSSRILKRMLEELSDPANRGRIVWVGITNFPEKLDAALSRAGRFDLTVAFLPPTLAERAQLIELYAGKYDVALPANVEDIAERLAGYTNAEIENIARKARQLQSKNVGDAWIESAKRVRANTRDVQSMTLSALRSVNDSDLLPAEYIDQWRRVTGQETAQVASTANSDANKALF